MAAALNVANVWAYPLDRNVLDWDGHVAYMRFVAEHWSVPEPTAGWEMYQPPLYYFVAAVVNTAVGKAVAPDGALRAVELIGVFASAGLAVIAWRQAHLLMPADWSGQLVATGFAALVPMNIYLAPIVSNELLAACLIALAIYALLIALCREARGSFGAAIGGLAGGVAMLAKFTALFALLAGGLVLLLRIRPREKRTWMAPIWYGLVAASVCGWFYLRNLLSYGSPFVGNWDQASSFALVQEPSFRTLDFFLRFGGVFFQHPTRSIWTSWLDGMYATIWADSHSVLVDSANDTAVLWMGVLLVVALLPTATIGLGFIGTLARALRGGRDADSSIVMVLVSSWTWIALVWFALRIPGYSTVKAFYFLSLTPTLGVFLARGRNILHARLPAAGWVLDGTLAIAAVLVLWIYRVS